MSKGGPLELRKAVAQAFVHELRVKRKDLILPTFRVLPGLPIAAESGESPVRTMTGSVGLTEQNKNLVLAVDAPLVRLSQRHGKVRRDGYSATRRDEQKCAGVG